MDTNHIQFLLNFPQVMYHGKLVTPSSDILGVMYQKSDYVARVISQVYTGPFIDVFSQSSLLTILYTYVKEKQKYMDLVLAVKNIVSESFLSNQKEREINV